MIKYIIYNAEGKILETGFCIPEEYSNLGGSGLFVMEGDANAAEHKIQNGQIVPRTDLTITSTDLLVRTQNEIRQERTRLLALCDWTQVPDNALSTEDRNSWRTYRQQLRDLPNQNSTATDIESVSWPEPPFDFFTDINEDDL